MSLLNSRIYRFTERLVDFLFLNFIWLLFCLPLVTAFPATTAMFGVVRKWHLEKDEQGVIRSFWVLFKENFKNSLIISLFWVASAIFLYMDVRLIKPSESLIQLLLFIITIFGITIFMSVTMYLFSVLVHVDAGWKTSIRNAWFIALLNPFMTIIVIALTVIWLYAVYLYPVLILCTSSLVSYLLYGMSHRIFRMLNHA
ncbi:DUF624 domain-containing protein [Pontibacillus sp. ALD_SL1]|uniref:YesL family protein n=1 Tax=Pontibacillus sp. ALD_SL1 TaxID=2777185 RepID=UPI001A97631B|nr:DUF624 domain-containing protein [Pontibacillus sp. ALD_SL1]QSS98784.1 DUF624 domain-containing protein [Pontibacillus sp. ALD_SL1]